METTRALGITGPLTLKKIMGCSNKQNGLRCNETVLQAVCMSYTGTKPKSILIYLQNLIIKMFKPASTFNILEKNIDLLKKQRTTLDQLTIQ